jgi:lysylphosphatidylglycerol synthetase-like protein (DUF2156 family)
MTDPGLAVLHKLDGKAADDRRPGAVAVSSQRVLPDATAPAPLHSPNLRASLLRRYGSFTQAYAVAFQPGLQYFGDAHGLIAYRWVGRTAFVLADPLCAPEYSGQLIRRFVAKFKDACFMQVSRTTAETLLALGFMINEMGTEARIDLSTHTFAGRKSRTFRLAINRAEAKGYVTRECVAAEIGEAAMEAVSARWRRTRTIKSREIRFLNRPIVFDDEPDVRKFYTFDRDGRLIAMAFFDPVYEAGRVIGYLTAFRRHVPDADPLINYAITAQAIETFRAEGRKWLFLGLSPLADIEDKDFNRNWIVRRGFRFVYKNSLFNRYIFPLQGIAAHKREYSAETYQTYFAFNTLPALPRLLKALWVTRLI